MTTEADKLAELLPCPFCGADADPDGWLDGDGNRGPECEGCGATAMSAEDWNKRAAYDANRSQEPKREWLHDGTGGMSMQVPLRTQGDGGKVEAVARNVGHGHVFPRPDGVRARCGGPGICKECAVDLARKNSAEQQPAHPAAEFCGMKIVVDPTLGEDELRMTIPAGTRDQGEGGKVEAWTPRDTPRNWPDDDLYLNVCSHCGNEFFGGKRRVVCHACAPCGEEIARLRLAATNPAGTRRAVSDAAIADALNIWFSGGDKLDFADHLKDHKDRMRRVLESFEASHPAGDEGMERALLRAEDVEWVVNDIAELGVKIGNQFFFCYKGRSLCYEDPTHDDGDCGPMHWRPVGKREFGECVHPVNWDEIRTLGYQKTIGRVSLDDSDEWQLLPAAIEQKAANKGEMK